MSDDMSPDASPGTGVRRVNQTPKLIIFGIVGAFLLVMAIVAYGRAEQQNAPAEQEQVTVRTSTNFADQITSDVDSGGSGFIAPVQTPNLGTQEQVPEEPVLQAVTPAEPPVTPTQVRLGPPANDPLGNSGNDEISLQIKRAKLQQLQQAINAGSSVTFNVQQDANNSNRSSTPQTRSDALSRIAEAQQFADEIRNASPAERYQARLDQIQSSIDSGGVGNGALPGLGGTVPNIIDTAVNETDFQVSTTDENGDRWKLNSQVKAPSSPFEMRAGTVIPGTIRGGINSDLPGQISAQVSQNVYDTATGNHLLIPQGSQLTGFYSSEISFGQKRVMVAWQRIIFPDGKALDIGEFPGADEAGFSGFRDRVNTHFWRTFGNALLLSGITAGVTLSQDNGNQVNQNFSQRAGDAISESLGQQLGQVTAQVIARNLNVSPTLEIRPGYRFNVVSTRDITFSKPYEAFDYK